jgi:hypothetical protein
MARNRNNDFVTFLRSQGLRKRVARALSDLEGSSRGARGNAEKLAQRVISDLRSAAEEIEKRLDIGGAGSRSSAAKKGAKTRKRAATKRSSAAKKGAAKRASKSSGRKTTARKSTARKSGRKTARKSSARKRS